MDRGTSELAVVLKRDPFGLLPADACAPGEKLLYIEDFQDGKAQGWQNITGATDFGAKNGWMLGPIEQGNNAVYFTGTYHDLDAFQDMTFDNVVWRLKVMTTGKNGWSFLNLKFSDPNPEGGTRYVVQWGATPQLDLTRMQIPSPGPLASAEQLQGHTGPVVLRRVQRLSGTRPGLDRRQAGDRLSGSETHRPRRRSAWRSISRRIRRPCMRSTISPCASWQLHSPHPSTSSAQ